MTKIKTNFPEPEKVTFRDIPVGTFFFFCNDSRKAVCLKTGPLVYFVPIYKSESRPDQEAAVVVAREVVVNF